MLAFRLLQGLGTAEEEFLQLPYLLPLVSMVSQSESLFTEDVPVRVAWEESSSLLL